MENRVNSVLCCFYCGVDSSILLKFLIGMIGSLALATIFLFFGVWFKGGFSGGEDMATAAITAEMSVESKNDFMQK